MKYKISLSTYNPAIVEALSDLGYKKSQYIEQALIHFLKTKKGKTTLRLMVHNTTKVHRNEGKRMVYHPERKPIAQEEAVKVCLDGFLE